jgi:hypothetical protein
MQHPISSQQLGSAVAAAADAAENRTEIIGHLLDYVYVDGPISDVDLCSAAQFLIKNRDQNAFETLMMNRYPISPARLGRLLQTIVEQGLDRFLDYLRGPYLSGLDSKSRADLTQTAIRLRRVHLIPIFLAEGAGLRRKEIDKIIQEAMDCTCSEAIDALYKNRIISRGEREEALQRIQRMSAMKK